MPNSASSPGSKQVTVEHIGTEPMRAQDRERAIATLAALITAWQHDQEEPSADVGAPLPHPGTASDTDHAA